jgi:hypothetical protein
MGSRSADIVRWRQEHPDPTAPILYMDEEFSSVRFGCVAFMLFSSTAIGGSVFVSYKGYETPTQSWLAVVSLVFAVLFFGLYP